MLSSKELKERLCDVGNAIDDILDDGVDILTEDRLLEALNILDKEISDLEANNEYNDENIVAENLGIKEE